MEKNKQDTNDIGNTHNKKENPFKATNPPGKKKKRWRSTRIRGSGDGPWRKSQAPYCQKQNWEILVKVLCPLQRKIEVNSKVT